MLPDTDPDDQAQDLEVQPLHLLFCDDIRTERSGKEILIGVYSGIMTVPVLPTPGQISLWVAVRARGKGTISLRLNYPQIGADGEQTEGQTSITAQMDAMGRAPGSLATPPMPFVIGAAGELTVDLKIGDAEWQRIGSMEVVLDPAS